MSMSTVSRLSSLSSLAGWLRRGVNIGTHPSGDVWSAAAVRAIELIQSPSKGSPVDVCDIVFSFGCVGHKHEPLLSAASTFVVPYIPGLSLGDFAKLLAGFARVGVRNDTVFELACREIARKAPSGGKLPELANILFALSTLNYRHPLLVEVVGKRVMIAARGGAPKDLVKTVRALAKMGVVDAKLNQVLSGEICRKIDQFPPIALAQILHASGHVLAQVVLDEAHKQMKLFDAPAAALLLAGMARGDICAKKSEIFEFFIDTISKKNFASFTCMKSLVHLAAATAQYHRGGNASPEKTQLLFAKIGDRVADLAFALTPNAIAQLLPAFAQVGCRHGPLLYNTPAHVKNLIHEFTLPEIAATIKAYADLDIRNDTLLDVVPPRLLGILNGEKWKRHGEEGDEGDRVGMTDMTALVDVVETYAKLMVAEREVLELATMRMAQHQHLLFEFQREKVLPKCFAILSITPPPSLRQITGPVSLVPS